MAANGLFPNSSNILVTDSVFNVFNQANANHARAFEHLQSVAVLSASHHSGESFDRPKCHENTRVAVLDRLMSWASGEMHAETLVMWLYGDAGAGKSAIAQTLAERLQALLLGSFFFSRNDGKRSTHTSLVATIAIQAATAVPGLKELITTAVERDPTIFEKKLETQLTSLLIEPINTLSANPSASNSGPIPHVIVIDGLDECTNPKIQQHILQVISDTARKCSIPLKILIASRAETEIVTTFNSHMLKSVSTRLALDASFKPDVDIRYFLEKTFEDIKSTHYFKSTLEDSWPKSDVLDQLVQKSSGQFIYASTVAKYVSQPRYLPAKRLNIVLGLQSPASERDLPFASLDAFYMHIFSSIPPENLQMTTLILGLLIIAKGTKNFFFTNADTTRSFLFLELGDLEFYLGDLAPVLEPPKHNNIFETLRITHASLADFLLDKRRSKGFHISEGAFFVELSRKCLQQLKLGVTANPDAILYSYESLIPALEKAHLTPELQEDLLGFSLISTSQWLQRRNGNKSWSHPFITFATKMLIILEAAPNVEALLSPQLQAFDAYMMRLLGKHPASDGVSFIPVLYVVKAESQWDTGSFALDSFLGPFFQERTIEYTMDCVNLCTICRLSSPYVDVLLDFFHDQTRSREYSLTSDRYAAAALLWFYYICEDHFIRDIMTPLVDGHTRRKYATLLHALVYLPQILERSSASPKLIAFMRVGDFDRKYGKLRLCVDSSEGERYFGVANFNYGDFVPGTTRAIKDYLKRMDMDLASKADTSSEVLQLDATSADPMIVAQQGSQANTGHKQGNKAPKRTRKWLGRVFSKGNDGESGR